MKEKIRRFINKMISKFAYHYYIGKGNKHLENAWKANDFALKYKIKKT